MPHRFILISRWRLQDSPAAVWQLLTDIDVWPLWWHAARCTQRAASSPLGDVAELNWRSALPCAVGLRIKTVVAERPHRIECHAQGDLQGVGTWLLEPADGGWVDVTYRWEVRLDRPWMRLLSILLRPLFEWNHFTVMRAAADGMGRRLGCRVVRVSEWSGSRWP